MMLKLYYTVLFYIHTCQISMTIYIFSTTFKIERKDEHEKQLTFKLIKYLTYINNNNRVGLLFLNKMLFGSHI